MLVGDNGLIKTAAPSAWRNATLTSEITPEYLGVGYIIGPRIAGIMVSGSVLSWLALIPLLSLLVPVETIHADLMKLGLLAGLDRRQLTRELDLSRVRALHRRGRGGDGGAPYAACARCPRSTRRSATPYASCAAGSAAAGQARTERDMPITWVAIGSIVLALIIPFLQKMPVGFPVVAAISVLIVVFGFFFVAVSSRIVGLIGSSSNPISGMTIATLLGTCLIFVIAGWANDPSQQVAAQAAALSVGAIVCIAAANAGATSQDLKTGYLVGATPIHQQMGLLIGVLVSVAVIGFTLR